VFFVQFPQNIFKLLEQKRLPAAQMAKYLEISEASINGWKNGSYPSSKHIVKISEFLDISVDCLLKGDAIAPVKEIGEDFIVTDNNSKLLISLLDIFDDEFDKVEFVSSARKLAQSIKIK
jgi:transcriptional regulator with XRE-family HTH domain